MDLRRYFEKQIATVDGWLDAMLPAKKTYPPRVHDAMRYAVMSGGKRIRPILAIACCESVGGRGRDAMIPACAIEMIHTYSLIHDDLPCMDDDDYRRGKPTVHKKFDEAIAVLAGDALLTYAAEIIARMKDARVGMRILKEMFAAAGTRGMLGGQVVDIAYAEKKTVTVPVMDYINIHKTGKLIAASCLCGAIAGGASVREARAILSYGEYLGLVFQLVDDIIDGDGYVRFFGHEQCLRRAEALTARAKKAIKNIRKNRDVLNAIADFVLARRK